MATALATGQFTIVDYNDAPILTSYISSNLALTQIYNPDNSTYAPNFKSTNLVLTPSLYVSTDSASDAITSAKVKSIKWFDGDTEITGDATYVLPAFSSTKNRPLTIKDNVLSGSTTSKTFQCEIIYEDVHTNSMVPIRSSITITRVNNGGGTTLAQIITPKGNIFKNGQLPDGAAGSLTAEASLLRASGPDTSDNTYVWYRLEGGVYVKITSVNAQGITGYAQSTLVIPPSAVNGLESFKVEITDNDNASGSKGQVMPAYVSIIDQTDPLQIQVVSSAGDVLKNGQGSTILNARVFRSGTEMDELGTEYAYHWFRADKLGNTDANFGGTGVRHKTGKKLTVDQTMVSEKAVFTVDLFNK